MKWLQQFLFLVIFLFTIVTIHTLSAPQESLLLKLETNAIEHIPPHQHNHGDSMMLNTHHQFMLSNVVRPANDLFISRAEFKLHNADATTLHHASLASLSHKLWYCPERTAPLFSIGEDQMHRPILVLPKGYAQFIPAGSPLILQAMIHNPLPPIGHGRDYYNVSAEIKLFSPTNPDQLKRVEMIQLNLIDDWCGDDFVVPENTTNFVKGDPEARDPSPATHRFVRPGRLIYLGGHVHGWEGGQHLDVYLNGELIKRFNTSKAADDPYRYDTEHGPIDIQIKAGDVMTITATYSNNSLSVVTGAMGVLAAYFSPDN